jgi:hypothetical protein
MDEPKKLKRLIIWNGWSSWLQVARREKIDVASVNFPYICRHDVHTMFVVLVQAKLSCNPSCQDPKQDLVPAISGRLGSKQYV